MLFEGSIDPVQLKALKAEIDRLKMPARKRQRLLWRMLKYGVMVAARRHQKKQQNADGEAWEPRFDGRTTKMMRHLPGMMVIHENPARESAHIWLQGAKKVPPGVVGRMQSQGMTVTVTAAQARREPQSGGCTLRQAKCLQDMGYMRYPVSLGTPSSLSEIMATLSKGKAGIIIREMQGREPATHWQMNLPAREWLSVSDDEFDNILVRQLKAINFGWRVQAQDIKGKTQ